ncbi:hypothetical protein HPO94_12120 [Citrobacter portucalensis]|uniref:hypothetical protein n=1 Tax=Citrobacter portucalensis TaxID=1639133 RepID=UPI002FF30006
MADAIEDFLNNVASQLDSKQVKVGFIDGVVHEHSNETVAQIAAWNEYGQPENNQPPRPFFRNAINEHEKEWQSALAKMIRSGMDVDQALDVLGGQIQGDVRISISELMDPPLSPATLKIRRTRKTRRTDSTKPLVDSGEMFDGVSYEVGDIEST